METPDISVPRGEVVEETEIAPGDSDQLQPPAKRARQDDTPDANRLYTRVVSGEDVKHGKDYLELVEFLCKDEVKHFLAHGALCTRDQNVLRSIVKNSYTVRNDTGAYLLAHKVRYEFSQKSGSELARYYPTTKCISGLTRNLRNALCVKLYDDCDMKLAFPSIFASVLEHHGIDCGHVLMRLLADREGVHVDVANELEALGRDVDKDKLKIKVTSVLMMGNSEDSITLKQFREEIQRAIRQLTSLDLSDPENEDRRVIQTAWKEAKQGDGKAKFWHGKHGHKVKWDNPEGVFVSKICSHYERLAIIEFMRLQRGRGMVPGSYEWDGEDVQRPCIGDCGCRRCQNLQDGASPGSRNPRRAEQGTSKAALLHEARVDCSQADGGHAEGAKIAERCHETAPSP
jgi:hypothetical protein